jgi:hypothetical protein
MGGRRADGSGGRQAADEEGGYAHHHECQHQHLTAPYAVAIVPDHACGKRTDDISDSDGGHGQDGAQGGVDPREEDLVEDQRGR